MFFINLPLYYAPEAIPPDPLTISINLDRGLRFESINAGEQVRLYRVEGEAVEINIGYNTMLERLQQERQMQWIDLIPAGGSDPNSILNLDHISRFYIRGGEVIRFDDLYGGVFDAVYPGEEDLPTQFQKFTEMLCQVIGGIDPQGNGT